MGVPSIASVSSVFLGYISGSHSSSRLSSSSSPEVTILRITVVTVFVTMGIPSIASVSSVFLGYILCDYGCPIDFFVSSVSSVTCESDFFSEGDFNISVVTVSEESVLDTTCVSLLIRCGSHSIRFVFTSSEVTIFANYSSDSLCD
ncbi:hypothetical protein CEXT_510861 [Caerostris extrusa]|uniref:Uncharacterized protein n=1 Tax=Caerostris extrusa TaxID=172846 RepID=A0AAV4XJQ6_CAEEX|nr:hypothetical protein CEXT_510861 [Caerostris extrusa]